MPAKVLMIQGTGSDVGKSLLTAALCRIFAQDGYRVLPFKAQNMSNNADVTADNGEIGRAQAEQARACGVEPSVLMNPILLKPSTDIGSQVVVLGKAVGTYAARAYEALKPQLRATVTEALRQLREQADILVIEGAGSPAEINLREHDLVNMWMAKQAGARVLLVGDIDRGGIFAQLVGTMELLEPDERALVRGFLINKFRGDFSLLEPGIRWLEDRCGLPVVGTVPYLPDVELAEEDAACMTPHDGHAGSAQVTIEVIRLPRISNFTDFDALAREPDVRLAYLDRPSPQAIPDAVIIPGTKSTVADLAFMRARGFDRYLNRCLSAGREVVGICGGFQMLGRQILDPDHMESAEAAVPGLGLLPAVTVFQQEKNVTQIWGVHLESGLPVRGYEIHMGRMRNGHATNAVFKFVKRGRLECADHDGLASDDGRVWGTHLHGLFDENGFRRWWLNRLRQRQGLPALPAGSRDSADGIYDRLAAAVRGHVNLAAIYQMLST